MNFYIHGILHHLQNTDIIIHCRHIVQSLLKVNIHVDLHKLQHNKNKLETFCVQCRKRMNEYIQSILHCMHTEIRESKPLVYTEWISGMDSSFIIVQEQKQ